MNIFKIIKNEHPLRIAEPSYAPGNASLLEVTILSMLAKTQDPKTIFEIGTFDGRTTLNLALNSAPDTKIYTIDLPKEKINSAVLPISRNDQNLVNTKNTGLRFLNKKGEEFKDREKIIQLYGDTATFDFSPYFGKIDMVFVDGAHTYEYLVSDSQIALRLLRNGKGIILWHDYNPAHQGVIQALNELYLANPGWNMFHIEDTILVCLISK